MYVCIFVVYSAWPGLAWPSHHRRVKMITHDAYNNQKNNNNQINAMIMTMVIRLHVTSQKKDSTGLRLSMLGEFDTHNKQLAQMHDVYVMAWELLFTYTYILVLLDLVL